MGARGGKDRYVGTTLLLLLAVAVGVGFWKVAPRRCGELVAVQRHPKRMMGTHCTLAAVVPRGESEHGMDALREAETVLRTIEARMSSWLEDSQISQLNRAGAHTPVSLSADVVKVFALARDAYEQTGGVFDVTCRPSVELWKRAVQRDRLPTDRQISAARDQSRWEDFHLARASVKKRSATAAVDLGGIAKGYALDRALAVMQDACVDGGLIDVGGDIACFGRPPQGRFWSVDVRDPFAAKRLTTLHLAEGAVCTSGDYARYRLIEGQRYSHIIDPCSGRPTESVPSVTVVAPGAVTADIWATALSVLGPEGFDRLPPDVDALLIVGTANDYNIYCTPGMSEYLARPLPKTPIIVER